MLCANVPLEVVFPICAFSRILGLASIKGAVELLLGRMGVFDVPREVFAELERHVTIALGALERAGVLLGVLV